MNHPEIFYKYTSDRTAVLILESGKIRWSSPFEFNDLSEFQRMPSFNPTIEEVFPNFVRLIIDHIFDGVEINVSKLSPSTKTIIEFVRYAKKAGSSREELLDELMIKPPFGQDKITSELRSHIETWGNEFARVFCVTTEYDNEVMWVHYAGNHSGCVLGFRHIPEFDTPLLAAKPVSYTDGAPIVCNGMDFLLYGDTPELRNKSVDAICYSKDQKWSYEREWRVVTWRHNEIGKRYGDYKFYPGELESITFGPKISDEHFDKILELVDSKYKNCDKYIIVVNNGRITQELEA